MNVGKLGHIKSVYSSVEPDSKQAPKAQSAKREDSISISSEAKDRYTEDRLKQIVQDAPDVRQDKVEEAKRKMESQTYLNDILYDKLVDAILNNQWQVHLTTDKQDT